MSPECARVESTPVVTFPRSQATTGADGLTSQDTAPTNFGRLLREAREARGMSLSDLANSIHCHRGSIGNVENGQRFPDKRFAQLADRALRTDGALRRAWDLDSGARAQAEHRRKLLECAVAGSADLLQLAEPTIDLDSVEGGVRDVAVGYLGTPAIPVLEKACSLRQEITFRLRESAFRPDDQTDLLVAAGRLSGVLAYAALDLGHPPEAFSHTDAAWRCAEVTGDDELRAWVRGTQSLILRFGGAHARALQFAIDGQQYASRGTGLSRLLSGEAQCRANMGDSRAANTLLDRAESALERHRGEDSVGGLFEFKEAKLRYYTGSSLIWLDGGADAVRAAREATEAIRLWQAGPLHERSLDDEALAHVYLATALLQLGEVEGAMSAVRPVLDLPPDRQISWITKRLGRLLRLLDEPFLADSRVARDAVEELRAHLAE